MSVVAQSQTSQVQSNAAENPVGALQDHLRHSFEAPIATRASRAAQLHLINALSRGAPFCLALILIASLAIGAYSFSANPVNALVWSLMMVLSVGTAIQRTYRFRAGVRAIAGRPFKWRTDHCAHLVVIGTALASGIILLASASINLLITTVMLAFVASYFQRAHLTAVVALNGPVILVALAVGVSMANIGLVLPSLAVIMVGLFSLILACTFRAKTIAKTRYPRTQFARDIDLSLPTRLEKLQRNTSLRNRRTA